MNAPVHWRSLVWSGFGDIGLPIALRCSDIGYRIAGLLVDGHGAAGFATLRAAGARRAGTEQLAAADALVLCLPRPADIDAVLASCGDVTPRVVVDLSTGDPATTRARAMRLAERGITLVDAPVSGSIDAARAGELTVFAGASPAEHGGLREFLYAIGKNVFAFESVGQGHAAKLVNQLMHLAIIGVLGDGLRLARALGLDRAVLVRALKTASSNSQMLDRFGDSIIQKNFAPQFRLELALKDLELVTDALDQLDLELDYQAVTIERFRRAADRGWGQSNFSRVCDDDA